VVLHRLRTGNQLLFCHRGQHPQLQHKIDRIFPIAIPWPDKPRRRAMTPRHPPSEMELRRGESATWGPPPAAEQSKPKMQLLSFREFRKNSLRGFATIALPNGLTVHDISVLISHGKHGLRYRQNRSPIMTANRSATQTERRHTRQFYSGESRSQRPILRRRRRPRACRPSRCTRGRTVTALVNGAAYRPRSTKRGRRTRAEMTRSARRSKTFFLNIAR
jgi:hypothetical protein